MENVTTAAAIVEDYILSLRIALYDSPLPKDLVTKAKDAIDNKSFEVTEDNISYKLLERTA